MEGKREEEEEKEEEEEEEEDEDIIGKQDAKLRVGLLACLLGWGVVCVL